MRARTFLILALLFSVLAIPASWHGKVARHLGHSVLAPETHHSRVVYPFSLVPGGTLTTAELRSRPDQYARRFYGDLDYKTAEPWYSYGESHYNSYRIGITIYQKTTLSRTRPGELLIRVQRRSGEIVFIRARCGNLLLDHIVAPNQPESEQPSDSALGDGPPDSAPPTLQLPGLLRTEFHVPDFVENATARLAPNPPFYSTSAPAKAASSRLFPSEEFAPGEWLTVTSGPPWIITSQPQAAISSAEDLAGPVAPVPEPALWCFLPMGLFVFYLARRIHGRSNEKTEF
jgi:hypothetical protein